MEISRVAVFLSALFFLLPVAFSLEIVVENFSDIGPDSEITLPVYAKSVSEPIGSIDLVLLFRNNSVGVIKVESPAEGAIVNYKFSNGVLAISAVFPNGFDRDGKLFRILLEVRSSTPVAFGSLKVYSLEGTELMASGSSGNLAVKGGIPKGAFMYILGIIAVLVIGWFLWKRRVSS